MHDRATVSVRFLSGEREPVRVATTANIVLDGLQTIDGIALAVNDRVLVKDQTDARLNGIWTASSGLWHRASDARFPRAIAEGVTVHVQDGTAHGGQAFRFRETPSRIGDSDIFIDFYLSANFTEIVQEAFEGQLARIESDGNAIIAEAQQAADDALAIAETYEDLQQAVDEAALQVASVIPSVQRFAVGAAVQSIDLGNVELHPAAVRVFIDGVYQFGNTWDLTDGVITPVGGSWPGDGIAENMEVVIDATSAIAFMVPSNGSVTPQKLADGAVTRPAIAAGAVSEDELDPALLDLIEDGGGSERMYSTALPFGRAGVRVLRGDRYDAHYGLPCGWIVYPSGKWVLVYRKGTNHGIRDNSEVRAADSYDRGATLVNDRLIYKNQGSELHDARPDTPRVFANGRSGFMVNRQDQGSVHFSPLLIYSDDEFETWSSKELTLPSPYTFSSTGGIMDFPASQGGHDTEGFIAYGFVSAGSYGRISTDDNWETYTVAGGVANLTHTPSTGSAITMLSEWSGARIGNQDKWIFYLRSRTTGDAWRDEAACFVTTNMLDWGNAVPSNINLGANAPCSFSDPETNQFHFVTFARSGFPVDNFGHHMLVASADADALWAANGNWAALTYERKIVPVPSWATGYMAAVRVDDSWMATFVCGESVGGDRSIIAMIGDFTPSSVDILKWADVERWNSRFKYLRAGFTGAVTPPASGYVAAAVDGSNAAFVGFSSGAANRTYYEVRNTNGLVGSIATTGETTTSFNTTSDGRLKVNRVGLAVELDIGAIIDGLEPVAYDWLNIHGVSTGERGYGLIAQDVHKIVPSAVTPGRGSPGDHDYVPWSMDPSKLAVFFLAELKAVRARLNALEGGE